MVSAERQKLFVFFFYYQTINKIFLLYTWMGLLLLTMNSFGNFKFLEKEFRIGLAQKPPPPLLWKSQFFRKCLFSDNIFWIVSNPSPPPFGNFSQIFCLIKRFCFLQDPTPLRNLKKKFFRMPFVSKDKYLYFFLQGHILDILRWTKLWYFPANKDVSVCFFLPWGG